ncbi:hypothetical protein DF147_28155 [Burkholderia cenocepacia]|nr:hypothetical protein DF147_28155 [Burkholderia cenocepacia]RQU88506.1 hypothetical protein DF133_17285 [Burkholderia cenocepacia]RQV87751.1 hypothetical protein DF019_22425 [Burkholderia cenocepacia]
MQRGVRRLTAGAAPPGRRQGRTRHRARRTGNRCAGRIVAAHVMTGTGYPRLDAAARDVMLASRCAAHGENGAPSPMRARAPIPFNPDE